MYFFFWFLVDIILVGLVLLEFFKFRWWVLLGINMVIIEFDWDFNIFFEDYGFKRLLLKKKDSWFLIFWKIYIFYYIFDEVLVIVFDVC